METLARKLSSSFKYMSMIKINIFNNGYIVLKAVIFERLYRVSKVTEPPIPTDQWKQNLISITVLFKN